MSSVTEALRAVRPSQSGFDVRRIRQDFPILRQEVRGKPLVYLDNAATTQKPQVVLDTLMRYYTEGNANINRAVHLLSERATQAHADARVKVQKFVNAAESQEIVFTRNSTEGINLVAQTYGRQHVRAGDEIVISEMEHHSNIVPWQLLCEEKGARLRVVPITDAGELRLDEFERLLGPRTKFVSIVHLSNSLGTINPVSQVVEMAHLHRIPVLIDGSQAAYHLKIDVQALDCDFYVFTAHKLYGPTGIGVLYGKANLLDAMPPYQGGGDMISSVTFEKTTYNVLPYKFEAGTPHIAGAIGLGAAIDYVTGVGMDRIRGARAGAAGVRHGSAVRGARVAVDRDGCGKGRHLLVRPRGSASARCRHDCGSGRGGYPHRPPLYAAADAAVRGSRHGSGLAGDVQHL